ncbi:MULTISPECIES: phospho-N-acetylmuramoyl-pentapeptide-transferase [Deinococcus]|jgi:phospho-N-acetylmuramoyl-pentapeptide-transferase|uniref:Phospho-N-acetylmuramoyl-pentapeptide-transferase n=2 Tax=Deinococcus soli (ex Cha et al. 2016) TaxID=1309411 RepID=A0A0F7JLT7_9DEIO|nr:MULTISPECIES: phospho-N-acetylmuramoyl-pentapeptide-transferase [Deinococcus]AKH16259.1 phospho-N-acetylmuramoyl-pentapeptide-transferase [Deinococcus soli (ex Cha et al. 2016)]MDK2011905.1 phospho-N-acetylmuramoyl-pentapeptide-transferase [Deinococcus sp. 43]MDR6216676.1 phospho-N-acetylmuramoyl-pentapeptide-transferase [Deinococcus soli (ex Cha et al. 2016)]MDR6327497.1 phospho-N-acetylmuramoyl-pentapeptide-transferase [Deinococcus soli (ex Cha et al. 2016)]MDR6749772.1 phospho-N-acetylmu
MMVVTALLSWFLVGLFVRMSRARGWGQRVRQDGPQTHLVKEGTPTAGGVPFVLALSVVFLPLYLTGNAGGPRELVIWLTALAMGVIGGVDDLLKIRSRMTGRGRSELLAREKFPLQFLVGLVFAYFAAPLASHELVPGFGPVGDVILLTLVMVGSVNAFNFTDGLDGLLGGVAIIVLLPLLALSPVSALLVAALLGFLWFNAHPARVFMGDMGSHAIGAVAAGAYVLYADVWLLPIAAIIPVVAVLSVVIQVASFKLRGKRVFKMSPIQHHFEHKDIGWPETHVTMRFWMVSAVATALVWWLLGGRP